MDRSLVLTLAMATLAGGCPATQLLPDAGPDAPSFPDAAERDAGSDAPDPLGIDDDGDGFTENEGDCDDADPLRFPGATEVCTNDADDDCDGVVDDGTEGATTYDPTEYRQASDSPFAALELEHFVLEDFEDQMLPAGVTASMTSWSSEFGRPLVDSVDGDDGAPADGACAVCEAMWSAGAITFRFDREILGGLPTHVGVVLTDAFAPDVTAMLLARSDCGLVGELSSGVTFGDGGTSGETGEDRFVGMSSPAGISSFTVTVGGAMEVDHLQFGW